MQEKSFRQNWFFWVSQVLLYNPTHTFFFFDSSNPGSQTQVRSTLILSPISPSSFATMYSSLHTALGTQCFPSPRHDCPGLPKHRRCWVPSSNSLSSSKNLRLLMDTVELHAHFLFTQARPSDSEHSWELVHSSPNPRWLRQIPSSDLKWFGWHWHSPWELQKELVTQFNSSSSNSNVMAPHDSPTNETHWPSMLENVSICLEVTNIIESDRMHWHVKSWQVNKADVSQGWIVPLQNSPWLPGVVSDNAKSGKDNRVTRNTFGSKWTNWFLVEVSMPRAFWYFNFVIRVSTILIHCQKITKWMYGRWS